MASPVSSAHLAHHRLFQRLAELDAAAGQRIDPLHRRHAAPHDQYPLSAENSGADRKIRPRGHNSANPRWCWSRADPIWLLLWRPARALFSLENIYSPMCARYVITSPADAIRALFGYAEQPNFPPRYNVAPTQPIPIVRLDEGKRAFALVRWGFLPSWVKDPRTFSLLVNARGGIRDRQAGLSQRHAAAALPGAGRWLLRMERHASAASFFRAAEGRRSDRLCRVVGDLDRTER